MPDNIQLDPTSGGSTVKTDEISGIHYPASKLTLGDDGVDDGFVSASNPLPVEGTVAATQSGTWNIATVTAVTAITNALPAGSNSIGTLGANSGVDIGDVTINNASGASAVNIQDGGNTITVDGTVTVTQGTAANLNATVVQTTASNLNVRTDTSYTEDTAHSTGDRGEFVLAVRNDAGGTTFAVDGDYSPIAVDANGRVGISDLGGTISIDDNGSSITVDGTVAATQSGTWNIATVTAVTAITNALPAGSNSIGTLGSNSGVDIGDVTINNTSGASAVNIQDGGNSITVDGTVAATQSGTWVLGANSGVDIGDVTINNASGGAAVNIQDGGNSITVDGTVTVTQSTASNLNVRTDTSFAEDAAHTTGDRGEFVLAVRNDSFATTLTNTDGDYSPIAVDSVGRIGVVGTFSGDVTVVQPTASNLNVRTDTSYAEDTAHSTGNRGEFVLAVRNDAGTTTFAADGDYSPIAVDANGRVGIADLGGSITIDGTVAATQSGTWNIATVTAVTAITNALPAGSNSIGTLGANSGVDIGDVTINNASGGSAVNIQDGGNSITVDGTVAATQSGTWNIATVTAVTSITNPVTIIQSTASNLNVRTDTSFAEDVAHTTGDRGDFVLAVRNDSAAALTSTDGDYSAIAVDSAGRVGISDLGGTISIDDAGGSITVDGTVAATQSGTWNIATVTAVTAITNALPAGSNSIGTLGANSGVDIGDVTINNASGGSAVNIQDGGNSITVDGTVIVTQSTASNLNVRTDTSYAEDVAHTTGDRGEFVLAVRNDSFATVLTNTDGDYSPIAVDSTGRIGVVGTFSGDVTVVQGTAANLNVRTDNSYAEDTAHSSGNRGDFILAVRNDAAGTTFTSDDGDYSPIAVDANGRVGISDLGGSISIDDNGSSITVDGTVSATQSGTWNIATVTAVTAITNALPAGTNSIGTLGANSGVDIGDVTINNASGAAAVNIQDGGNSITVDGSVTVTQGTAANLNATVVQGTASNLNVRTDTSYAEDTAHVSGDRGEFVLAVRNDSATALTTTDGDYSPIAVDSSGRVGISDLGGTISIDDAGSSITVDGTVAATQSGTWNIATVTAVTAITNALPAGSNSIGTLGANSGVDIGDVTINNASGGSAVNIQDGGNSITVDGSVTVTQGTASNLNVRTDNSYAEDTAHVSGDRGDFILAVRNDAGATTFGADGDYSPIAVDANGRIGIADLGGSITVDGTVAATQSGTWNIATVTAVTAITNALPAGSNSIGTLGANSGVDIGDVTINNASGGSAVNIQDGGNSITVDGTVAATQSGTWNIATVTAVTSITNAVTVSQGTAANLNVRTDNSFAEDSAHASGDRGNFVLGVRNDAGATTLTTTDGDYSPIAVDANGRIGIADLGGSITIDGTVAATQSGTWVLGANSGVDIGDVTINNASGASAVNIQDGGNSITVDGTVTVTQSTASNLNVRTDTSYAEDTAHSTGNRGEFVLGIRNDSFATSYADADGDYSPFSVDSYGRVGVISASSYPHNSTFVNSDRGDFVLAVRNDGFIAPLTGSDGAYSPIAVDQYGRVGVVFGGTSVTVEQSVASDLNVRTDSSYAEDSSHSSTDRGEFVLGVRNDNGATTLTDANGDYSPFAVDEYGRIGVTSLGLPLNISGTVSAIQSGTWDIGTVSAVTAITNALPAGSNSIGDIGTVGNVTSLGTLATITNPVTVAQGTAANLNVRTDSSYPEDVTHNTGDRGEFVLAVRNDSFATTFCTNNGEYSPIAVDSVGRIGVVGTVAATQSGTWILGANSGVDIGDVTINNSSGASAVNIQDGGNSITVDGTVAATQSGTWNIATVTAVTSITNAVTVSQGTAANLNVRTDNSFAEDTAHASGDRGNFVLAVRNDSFATTLTTTDGDYSPIAVDSNGRIGVIGTFAGDVTVVQPTAANLNVRTDTSYAEDTSHSTGNRGEFVLAVRNDDGATTFCADGDYSPVAVDAAGRIGIADLGGSITVDGTVAATQSGTWILGANSGVDIGDVTINNASGASAVNIQDGGNSITVDGTIAATQSGTWNIATVTAVTAITNALPAGSNSIGTLGANSGVDIGDVTINNASGGAAVNIQDGGNSITVDGSVTVTQGTAANLNATVVQGTASNLNVRTDNSYAEDTSHVSGDRGNFVLAVRNDAGATTFTSDDGDYSPIAVDDTGRIGITTLGLPIDVTFTGVSVTVDNASGASAVNIQDGGNSITVDGTIAATQSGTWNIATVTAVTAITNALPAGTNSIGTLGANSGVDIGDVTINNASGGSAVNIQDGGNSITVDGTVTVTQGTAANLNATVVQGTAANLNVRTDNSYAEDTAHVSGDRGNFVLAVRNDIAATLTSTDGDYSPIAVDDKGRVGVTALGGSLDVTVVGGSIETIVDPVTVTQSTAANLNVRTDNSYAEDSAHVSGDRGNFVLAVRNDTPSVLTTTNGDYSAFSVDQYGQTFSRMRGYDYDNDVYLDASLTDEGKLRISVDNAVLLQSSKTEDTVHSSGDVGEFILGVRNDSATALTTTNGDYSPIATDSAGRVGISDLGGSISIDDNGSSITIDGTVAATQSGTWVLSANSGVDIGDVTINNASGASAVNIQDGGNSITVDGTVAATQSGTWNIATVTTLTSITNAVTVAQGTAANLNVRSDTSFAEDVAHASGDRGNFVLAVRNDSGSTTFCANGDYSPIAVDSSGRVGIADLGGSVTVDMAGTSTFRYGQINNTAYAAIATAASLYGYHFINPNATICYLQMYNVASGSVTVGTTVPKMTILVPPSGATESYFTLPITFGTAVTVAATLADGVSALTNNIIINLIYI